MGMQQIIADHETVQKRDYEVMQRMLGVRERDQLPDAVVLLYCRMKHMLDVVDWHNPSIELLAYIIHQAGFLPESKEKTAEPTEPAETGNRLEQRARKKMEDRMKKLQEAEVG